MTEERAIEFAELLTSHQHRLYRYVISLLGDADAAWDVLQEANRVLLEKRAEFREGTSFGNWTLTVAQFQTMAWLRNRGRDRLVVTPEIVELISAEAMSLDSVEDEQQQALRRCRRTPREPPGTGPPAIRPVPETRRGERQDRERAQAAVLPVAGNAAALHREANGDVVNANPEDVRRQVVDALEDARDGSLDDERRAALRQLLLESEDARRAYLEFNNLNRLLSTPGSDAPVPVVASRTTTTDPAAAASPTARGSWGAFLVGLLATCAVVLVMVLGVATEQPAPTFATLVDAKGSTRISNTQPSRVGTRLGRGRMHVASGLVTIDFDHGVELVVEGPADFELIGRKRCRLHSGMVVATARPGGEGFVVETPEGIVVDRGTSFGLTAGEAGTDVVVFSGRVDVQDSDHAEPRSIEEGQHVRVTADAAAATRGSNSARSSRTRRPRTCCSSIVRCGTIGAGSGWPSRGSIFARSTPPGSSPSPSCSSR